MLYGITGTRGSGKDSFAQLIKKYNPNFRVMAFGDKVKEDLSIIFDIPLEKFYSQEKNSYLEYPIHMDYYTSKMAIQTGLDIQRRNKIALTYRELMQFYGTDYVKNTSSNYWINTIENEFYNKNYYNCKDKIIPSIINIIIADIRFNDETNMIKDNGGKVIKIIRGDILSDSHLSETQDIKYDLLLKFVKDEYYMQNHIAELLSNGKFEEACQSDYRHIENVIKYYNAEK